MCKYIKTGGADVHKALKSLYILIFALVFLFCGCQNGGQSKSKSLGTDFSADFCAEYHGLEVGGSVTANRQGVIGINISSPQTIEGISVSYKNGDVELRRDSMICSADEAYLPDTSFPSLLKDILDGISDGRAVLTTENSDCDCYNLKIENEPCIITADKNGRIINAKITNNDLYIEFSDFSPLAD